MNLSRTFLVLFFSFLSLSLSGEVSLPNIFGDHMVLQRDQDNPIWGTASPGEVVSVSISEQNHTTVADRQGKWRLLLSPLQAGGPHTLKIKGQNTLYFEDVLIGEVWFCSGQSNMEWAVSNINHSEVELATASNPQIRLITIAKNGAQIPQDNIEGQWTAATPQSVSNFSAVGFLFGKRLQSALNVPIGLIDNAWGGSAAEAWVPREVLQQNGAFDDYIKTMDERCSKYTDEIHAKKLSDFKAWEAAGKPEPRLRWPNDVRNGQHRPANIYNGMLHPLIGYGIKGVIWYQGESNASRSEQYRQLFPLMISTWRDLWKQGDFPFYWAQLTYFQKEATDPNADSWWARLREAQTMTRSLPNTGEAVIIDVGEGRDIHPRDKQTVADRLVRHALSKDYGFDMASDSPQFTSMELDGNSAIVTFDSVSLAGLRAFDVNEVRGFRIAGEDREFFWADAQIIGKNRIKVFSDSVINPVAVRYAWADNPVANLEDRNGLPVTPFRTDNW